MTWLALSVVALIGSVFLMSLPISTGLTRNSTLLFLLLAWIFLIVLVYRKMWLRLSLLLLPIGVILTIAVGGGAADSAMLRQEYVRCLREYNGAPYVFGGENILGIDCSGLIRKSMVNAYLSVAWRTHNPAAVRSAFDIWYNDCSTHTLRTGYGNRVEILADIPNDGQLGSVGLQKGDLALLDKYHHVLAYLGDNVWIEADPTAGKVILSDISKRGISPCRLARWVALR